MLAEIDNLCFPDGIENPLPLVQGVGVFQSSFVVRGDMQSAIPIQHNSDAVPFPLSEPPEKRSPRAFLFPEDYVQFRIGLGLILSEVGFHAVNMREIFDKKFGTSEYFLLHLCHERF